VAEGSPRRGNRGDATGRPNELASFLGHPGAKFLCGKPRGSTKKEKRGKKERSEEGLWKLTPLMEIRRERGFPPRLEKSLANNARLFHSSHKPDDGGDHLKKGNFLSKEWGAPPRRTAD
jgi:hypothetical protein